jgi:SAM-dependent methyltransferase
VSYAAITREDSSALKRWFQERRLRAAVGLVDGRARRVVDFGGGDGEVSARLAARLPETEIVCFEPAPQYRQEAEQRLAGFPLARAVSEEADLSEGWADTALCLEVLEHLPEAETEQALEQLHRCLGPGGRLVCGVPIEVGPPAAAKGLFRRGRRPEAFDARPDLIAAAAFGRPPAERPVTFIAPERAYHPHHLGFDHRRLLERLRGRFRVVRMVGSPFGTPLSLVNAELYILAVKEPRV